MAGWGVSWGSCDLRGPGQLFGGRARCWVTRDSCFPNPAPPLHPPLPTVKNVGEQKAVAEQYSKDLNPALNVEYTNCVQVHPWLLKRPFIEHVGYFDEQFSPHQCEDDDLMMRMIEGGWRSISVRVRGGPGLRG